MRKNHKAAFMLLLSFLLVLGILTWAKGYVDKSPSPDSPTLAPDTALNMLYDANLSNFSLKPHYTYWIDGKTCRKLSPQCRILRMESIVEVGNRTYLALFDFQNKTLNLVPTNETEVKEYLTFFSEHGGRVFACNSTVTVRYNNTTVKRTNGTCIIPAVVWVEEK
ncbi:hypothetical protein E3E36_10080 [Thermococcus sp. M36]|uniref:hypothetical protein n=1 Tax=Thermococcus sp. M36 TaxID=1638261 RepID=UPI0014398114|nr:hypothetical protein [Thermococcus sp. M36]NJE06481.1 hypothetical protein [Thermococcus sp. M36]